jgi:hypothetical protein
MMVIVLAVGLTIALKVSVWRECRSEHSWLYCVNLIGK